MARNKLLLRQITLLSKVPISTPVFDFCFCFVRFYFCSSTPSLYQKHRQKSINVYSIFWAFFTTFTPFLLKICILSRCVFYNISVFAASFKTFVFYYDP